MIEENIFFLRTIEKHISEWTKMNEEIPEKTPSEGLY